MPPRGESGGAKVERPEGRGCPGGDPIGGGGPSHISIVACNKYRGIDDDADVDGKWERTKCAGMERFTLPEILPISPIPPPIM